MEGLEDPVISDAVKSTLQPLFRNAKKRLWPIRLRGVLGQYKSVTIQSFCVTNSWSNNPKRRKPLLILSFLLFHPNIHQVVPVATTRPDKNIA
jgi:hypothetical protein